MTDSKTLLLLIPALPLAATLLTAALGKRVLRRRSHVPVVTAILLSFLASIMLLFQMQQKIDRTTEQKDGGRPVEEVVTLWRWANVDDAISSPLETGVAGDGLNDSRPLPTEHGIPLRIDVALRADPLTVAMLAIVTCISTLVAIYSIGYMRDDPGYWRFFAYIGLFVFSMTMLVSASNFVLLYVFWELVGLCSYLLIGFWFEKPAAAAAGSKAFLVNRIGDCGFLLGLFLIWICYGTLDFHDTIADGKLIGPAGVFGHARLAADDFVGGWPATATCLLLMLGACGKSAQFPLHVWLPDAMEGPTPVSALIHAATMVTAGVYMVARCMPLFAASPDAQYVVAAVGGLTALLGAIIAITQTDLKRILAYSTISHLGYMFLALGAGTLAGVTAGMFHLLTHAFFKALLFLGAGSVMHATGGVIDIRRLGGLRHRLPVTHWTFLIGCLAIAGVAPLAGFWSKDAILLAVGQRAGGGDGIELYKTLLATALLGVLLIDFYMFRPYFMTFWGREKIPPEAVHHAHESPGTMTGPLIVLAFGSLVVGAYFEWTHGLMPFLAATPSLAFLATAERGLAEPTTVQQASMAATTTVITLVGIAIAATLFLGSPKKSALLAKAMNVFGLYSLSYGKFFIDPLYNALIVWPLLAVARFAAALDHYVIDDVVDFCGSAPKLLGAAVRSSQNGLVQFYALVMMIGVLAALLGVLLM